MRILATLSIALVAPAFHTSTTLLPHKVFSELKAGYWHEGCPTPLTDLRLLTVGYWGFDNRAHHGQLVVNKAAAGPLAKAFGQLYELRFPIRHMRLAFMYGPPRGRPKGGDITGSFSCRKAVPSPCNGNASGTHWSNHAYGLALDLNPVENPYVGCGMTRDKTALSYLDRSNTRKGMVTPAVIRAFASVGWGWGGSWTGDTKDYMHFSYNGH
ncbi:MAG TPA: M15 family metallopeptidase [Gaiellaceae bacterium]|nr:M15 family metallopeptidase [Gaiellaceae bacterium]